MPRKKKKFFVLDTNVILHDSSCMYHFEENDVVVPIAVLEELDQFKKGNETLNHHAREFVRALDDLSGDKLLNGGGSKSVLARAASASASRALTTLI